MTSVIVTCNQLHAAWEFPPDHISLTDSADVWRVPVLTDLPQLAEMESLMPDDEIEKASRFRQSNDKHRFIVRKTVLRIILSKYLHIPATEILFIAGKNKKPGIKPIDELDLHYNVSDSGNWILISVSRSESGVDIEQTNTGFDYTDVLKESFSKAEIDYIQQEEDGRKSFFRLWTRKEALTKATSKGLDDDFASIPSLDGTHKVSAELLWSEKNWVINSFEIDKTHTASVALPPSKPLRFFDFVTYP